MWGDVRSTIIATDGFLQLYVICEIDVVSIDVEQDILYLNLKNK